MAGAMAKRSKLLTVFVLAVFIFTMIFGSIPAAGADAELSDVEGHWAQGTIQELVGEGIIAGYPDGTFRPNNKITRAEFATLIVKAFHLKAGPGKVFVDTAEHWAKDDIKTANHHGIIKGYSDNHFGPDDPITREQMATMITNVTKVDTRENGKTFTDSAQIADWAKEFVDKAAATGLIAGYPDGTFKPKAHATRAEAATVLDRGRKLFIDIEEIVTTYNKAGTYGPKIGIETIDDDVVISADGVILRNTVITGNLTISEEVGDGNVTLNEITVKGTTFIRGGGKDSIHISGGQYNNIIVESTSGGSVRVVATDVEGLKIVISEKAAGEEIVLEGTFESVEIKANDIVFATQGETTIDEIKVHEDLAGVTLNIEKGTTVKELVLDSV
ncbi:MAG: S-layer homology domain-containing protein, partial [Firmicutes bacterium]|nr:S-layer homology domain-containing protein [Bacillota bacterium]